MTAWAALVRASDSAGAAMLRLVSGVEVCSRGDDVWLRGKGRDETLDFALRAIGAEQFEVGSADALTPAGRLVPCGTLPDGPWEPLREWVRVTLPRVLAPATLPSKIPIRLVRSSSVRQANLLVCAGATFLAYAETAADIRLRGLTFAVSEDSRVTVRGAPVPAIPGVRCVEEGGIAVPCGYEVTPAVGAAVLREVLGLGDGDVALFGEDGAYDIIDADGFVAATRSAVRASIFGAR